MISKNWLIATVLVFVTICAWVIFETFHTVTKTEIPSETIELTKPLDPTFNTSVLNP